MKAKTKVKKAQGKDFAFGSREAREVRELGDRVPGTKAS